ncbi:hypothetical protein BO70DRAFT_397010 [Aspergillus heteromorphus CBS 117.55]|uniref:BZIP domain-containing protein n=1 Tax=Aspergillus heteromorphus CBS 117.55 TaxID=1448321 RepID=A0A317W6T7_9EURO|nr:uncharacterized protein BO70DRAFT_397010 [Aspergillus heteromorphus CBS 117.55]PWY80718.1 hypothetical protein BO70DRAFT_397010 [Aspergillus heteromorphus CBS 117.55]
MLANHSPITSTRGSPSASDEQLDSKYLSIFDSLLFDGDSSTEGCPSAGFLTPQLPTCPEPPSTASISGSPELWYHSDFMSQDHPYNNTDTCNTLSMFPSFDTNSSVPVSGDFTFNLDQLMAPQPSLAGINFSTSGIMVQKPKIAETEYSNSSSDLPNSKIYIPQEPTLLQPSLSQHPPPSPQRTSHQSPTQAPKNNGTPSNFDPPRSKKRSLASFTKEDSSGSDSTTSNSEEERILEKRQRNKMASRRLRQRQIDHVSDLESRLEDMTKERDDLRLQAAKWEAEVMVMRKLLDHGSASNS